MSPSFIMSPSQRTWLAVPYVVLLLGASVWCADDLKFEQSPEPSPINQERIASTTACGDGYCHIGDRCIPAGQRADPPDTCWECVPRQSTVAWSYSNDEECMHGTVGLDTWHLILIIVGSLMLVIMLVTLAGYRMKRHLLKRQRVYASHYVDVPHDKPLLKQMH